MSKKTTLNLANGAYQAGAAANTQIEPANRPAAVAHAPHRTTFRARRPNTKAKQTGTRLNTPCCPFEVTNAREPTANTINGPTRARCIGMSRAAAAIASMAPSKAAASV